MDALPTTSDPYKVNSLVLGPDVDPFNGTVRWDPLAAFLFGNLEEIILERYRKRSEVKPSG